MFWEGKTLSSSIYVPTEKKNRETDWSRFYKTHLVAAETPPLQGFLKRMPVQYGFIENFTITMLSSCHNDKQNLLPF